MTPPEGSPSKVPFFELADLQSPGWREGTTRNPTADFSEDSLWGPGVRTEVIFSEQRRVYSTKINDHKPPVGPGLGSSPWPSRALWQRPTEEAPARGHQKATQHKVSLGSQLGSWRGLALAPQGGVRGRPEANAFWVLPSRRRLLISAAACGRLHAPGRRSL